MSRVLSVGCALPPHRYEQEALIAAFREQWGKSHHNLDRVDQLHRAVCVGGRNLALPMEDYPRLESFGQANDAWIRVATDVGQQALETALAQARVQPGEL